MNKFCSGGYALHALLRPDGEIELQSLCPTWPAGTIRGDLGIVMGRNLCHASDSVQVWNLLRLPLLQALRDGCCHTCATGFDLKAA